MALNSRSKPTNLWSFDSLLLSTLKDIIIVTSIYEAGSRMLGVLRLIVSVG